MAQVGRNDPCPCGSGKKFKKCCLGKETSTALAFTPDERENVWHELVRFSSRQEFAGDRAIAQQAFWAGHRDDLDPDEAEEPLESSQSHGAFLAWLAFDFTLPTGRTIAEVFLARHRDRLRSGEQRYLERMRATHVRPYEVVGVEVDAGLDLVDLWTRERVHVREQLGTREIVQWDVIAGRLILDPAGELALATPPYIFPPSAADVILRTLRGVRRSLSGRGKNVDDTTFFKHAGPVCHVLWLDLVALRPPPEVRTAEGDELVFARSVFDVRDSDALVAALAGHPDLARQDDGSYVWLESGATGGRDRNEAFVQHHEHVIDTKTYAGRRSLGVFVLGEGQLALETASKRRAARGRRFIRALAGDAIEYRATVYEDAETALDRLFHELPPEDMAPDPESDADDFTPEEMAPDLEPDADEFAPEDTAPDMEPEVDEPPVSEHREQHYRSWLDTRLPALGDLTPREAARLERGRRKVITLLKGFENCAAGDRLEGRKAYDFSWMWAELGLDRPG